MEASHMSLPPLLWVRIAFVAFCLALPAAAQAQRLLGYASKDGENTDIHTMDANGGADKRVTTHPAFDRHPTWSPGRRHIAFESYRDGVPQVYVANRDGTGLRRLTDDPRGARGPDWHPTGTRVAYTVREDNGGDDIWEVDAESGQTRNISDTPVQLESRPAWSPDGEFIAAFWAEDPLAVGGAARIAIMWDDGQHVSDFGWPGSWLWDPSWAPDGRRLAVNHSPAGGGASSIHVLDIEADTLEALPAADVSARWPAWSPDGEEIAFGSNHDAEHEIYVLSLASRDVRRLTNRPGLDYEPAWAPLGLDVNERLSSAPTVWGWLKQLEVGRRRR